MPAPGIAILCSGKGSNFQAILDAIRKRKLRASAALMATDNPRAYAVARARRAGVPAVFIPPESFSTREAFDRALARVIEKHGARLIVLAGFMRILSPWFVRRFRGRILNVHPALLPSFPGAHAVRDALRHGVKVTGATVHFVEEEVDQGPILLQAAVPVKENDTEEILLKRIHTVEHRIYPQAIQLALNGRTRIVGRKVRNA